ncbi:hypothetical protein EW026_g7631 [Hermanssonia centrifuga]|uniref:Uncharacterized protein n=1 Tax=Hermanssonia centrifuga TaxID=98765 RepID=A0A4S4KBL2_9APHY|nr:hypothetical protein EW026_g7631 [Hermanssonia centrifuga]
MGIRTRCSYVRLTPDGPVFGNRRKCGCNDCRYGLGPIDRGGGRGPVDRGGGEASMYRRGPYGIFYLPAVVRSYTILGLEDNPDNHALNRSRVTQQDGSTSAASTCENGDTDAPHDTHDIGTRLPGEMLGIVLYLIQSTRKEERRQVAQMALTCKDWASQCQAVAFEWVKLRSGKDVHELLSLMESPHSHIASYIKTLWLIQEGIPTTPWIHLVALYLVPKLSLDPHRSIELDLDLDNTASGRLRSIYDGLPRVYSSFSTSHISRLFIQNASFESFADLAHLVDEIPSLRFLYLHKLTWHSASVVLETQPLAVLLPRRRTVPPYLNCVHLSACTDIVSGIDLLIGKRRKARGETTPFDLDLNHEQQQFIKNMSLTATDGLTYSGNTFELTMDPEHDTSVIFSLHFGQRGTLSFVITTFTEDSPSGQIKTTQAIKTIAIHSTEREHQTVLAGWVTRLCSHLTPIQELVVGFLEEDSLHEILGDENEILGDENEILGDENEILGDENETLYDLRSAGRLKYAVLGENKKWRLQTSEELKGVYPPLFMTNSRPNVPFAETRFGQHELWKV